MIKFVFESENNYSNDIIKKEEEYMKYIKNHIDNVIKSFENLVDNIYKFEDANRDDIVEGIRQLQQDQSIYKHDESKYSDEEFGPYRRQWHSINDTEKEESKEEYEEAWKHHYTVNPHHPEYWIVDGVKKPMKIKYIVEMFCDWESFGNIVEYYKSKKDKKKEVIHPESLEILETIINIMYNTQV